MYITLEPADAADYKNIKTLYKSAFPPEERPPFFIIKNKAKKGKAQMLAARDGETFIGFAYLICCLDMAYLFFFAIDEAKRAMGYGSEILRLLRERYQGKRLFLAREQLDETADNYSQRVSRRNFYRKSGFEDLPCRIKEASVVYDVMGIGGNISPKEYDELITSWAGGLIRKLVDMRVLE